MAGAKKAANGVAQKAATKASSRTGDSKKVSANKGGASKSSASKSSTKAAADALRPGDKVEWRTSLGPTTGVVKRKLTRPAEVKGHHAAASFDNPEYLVQSDKTQAQAIHKPGALNKRS